MDFTVHVFDSGEEGKKGFARALPVHLTSPRPAKVVDVLAAVLPQLDLNFDATKALALWCTSPLLELQLKPEQKVHSVLDRWQELLACYTASTAKEAKDDIPLLMLRRNCFFPKSQERCLDEKCLRLLYNEAQFNVNTYRYVPGPDHIKDYFDMAAVKMRLKKGPYNAEEHSVAQLKEVLGQYFTDQFIKPRFSGPGIKRDHRTQIAAQFQEAYIHCSSFRQLDNTGLYRRYLQLCGRIPAYGAVFFKGIIAPPRPSRMTLLDAEDVPVRVAINPEGVHLIHEERNETLANFAFDQISWEYEKAQKQGEHEFASLYLQFDGEVGNKIKCEHVIEIFSRQAPLMDAMIEQCVVMEKEEEDRVVEARRIYARAGSGEVLETSQSDIKHEYNDMKRLAKVVSIRTCIPDPEAPTQTRNFDGLPKAAELASLGPVATSPSTHRTTRV